MQQRIYQETVTDKQEQSHKAIRALATLCFQQFNQQKIQEHSPSIYQKPQNSAVLKRAQSRA